MSRWRIAVLLVFLALPVLILIALGSYFLWISGLGFTVWWPMTVSMAFAYFLAWHWLRKKQLLHLPSEHAPIHWGDRDLQAWKLVEARARSAANLEPAKFLDPHFYLDTAQAMAQELARVFHPGTVDPLGPITMPELLTVIELAAHDLADMFEKYVPAGHLITVSRFRKAQQAIGWYQKANNIYWMIGALFNPLETGARLAASHLGLSTTWNRLQENLTQWFYVAYVHELGRYLIDLESGRLKVGARRYRELMAGAEGLTPGANIKISPVTIVTFGQTKAGKSSLINALLGEQRAGVDVLPLTAEVARYELQLKDGPPLVILDTPGYAQHGLTDAQKAATLTAARDADLLLVVLHARNPAREPDILALTELVRMLATQPDRKAPPILGVLTHIDLLSPAMEWQPPYNWLEPNRPKELQISQAVATVREQFQESLAGCVPVCTESARIFGIQEFLLPAMVQLLPQARAVNLVRALHQEADSQKVQRILQQLLSAGKLAFRLMGERGAALDAVMPRARSQGP
jgi:predicted GTPase